MFCIGVSSLQLFIQSNWLGFSQFDIQLEDIKDGETRKQLITDGECFYPTIKDLQLLLIAKIILNDLRELFVDFHVWFTNHFFSACE